MHLQYWIKLERLYAYAQKRGLTFDPNQNRVEFSLAKINAFIIFFSAILGFSIGSCWLLLIIAKDITNDLKLLNGIKTPNQRRKIFYEILDFYVDAKQLSKMSRFSFLREEK